MSASWQLACSDGVALWATQHLNVLLILIDPSRETCRGPSRTARLSHILATQHLDVLLILSILHEGDVVGPSRTARVSHILATQQVVLLDLGRSFSRTARIVVWGDDKKCLG